MTKLVVTFNGRKYPLTRGYVTRRHKLCHCGMEIALDKQSWWQHMTSQAHRERLGTNRW